MVNSIKQYWPALAVAFAVVAVAGWWSTRQHRALGNALREAEQYKLMLKNQIVETQETRRQLQGSVDQALRDNADLRAAFDQARQAAPDAKPASVSELSTGPVVVVTNARPAPEPAPEPLKDRSCGVKCPACVLHPGDKASIQVDLLELKTDKGNTMVVGTAEAFREDADRRSSLFKGPFKSSLSTASELQEAANPRWGASVDGLCTRDGCGLGISALLPPFRVPLLGWRAEARIGVLAGPVLGASAGLGARW